MAVNESKLVKSDLLWSIVTRQRLHENGFKSLRNHERKNKATVILSFGRYLFVPSANSNDICANFPLFFAFCSFQQLHFIRKTTCNQVGFHLAASFRVNSCKNNWQQLNRRPDSILCEIAYDVHKNMSWRELVLFSFLVVFYSFSQLFFCIFCLFIMLFDFFQRKERRNQEVL